MEWGHHRHGLKHVLMFFASVFTGVSVQGVFRGLRSFLLLRWGLTLVIGPLLSGGRGREQSSHTKVDNRPPQGGAVGTTDPHGGGEVPLQQCICLQLWQVAHSSKVSLNKDKLFTHKTPI